MNNPVFSESLRGAFANRDGKRYLVGYLIVLCASSTVVWPFNDLAYFLRFGREPSSFAVMSILTLITATVVAAQFGIQQTGRFYSVREWFLMTPVNPASLLSGKAAAGIIHSGVLTTIAVPFLTVTAAPSGYGMISVFGVAALIFSVSILIRCIGIAVISVGENRSFISNVTIWICIMILFLLTLKVLPQWNPLLQVSMMASEFSVGPVIRYTSLSLIAIITAYAFLKTAQKRFQSRAKP